MRNSSTALKNLLNAGGTVGTEVMFLMADLYTFIGPDNTTILGRYAVSDIDLTVAGNTFTSMGPRITRNSCKWVAGAEVTELNLTIACMPTDMVGSLTFIQASVNGVFDGARCKHERVFMPTWGDTSAGTIVMNVYKVADLRIDGLSVVMLCRNLLETLNIMLPKNTYQPSCIHSLYDAGCTMGPASYAVSSSIISDPGLNVNTVVFNAAWQGPRPQMPARIGGLPRTVGTITAGGVVAPVADYYALGKIVFTSGQNNGAVRSVKSSVQSGGTNKVTASLTFPLRYTPAIGDAFTIYTGCDKAQPTCSSKFNNLTNFKGFPFIPVPETLLGLSNG